MRWGYGLVNAEVVAMLRPLDEFSGESGESSSGKRSQLRMATSLSEFPVSEVDDDGLARVEVFDATLAEHRGELLQYMCRRVRDRELAADLAQETLARMMKYRNAGDVQDLKLMLFRIANNLVFEHYRVRQRHHAGDHVSLDDIGPLKAREPSVESIVDTRQAIDILLKRTITELPTKCRLAFMLSRFDGLSYPQIAERMGITVKMVEKHITKALRACRAAVGDRDF